MESERRRSPRYPFLAAAELTESTSGVRLKASANDLSLNGCYLETINPLPQARQCMRVQSAASRGFNNLL
jgi:hypothetical protein